MITDSMPLTYSIIIPAYNESERLRPTLDELVRYFEQRNLDVEIVVVNDGSRTIQRPRARIRPMHPQIVLRRKPRQPRERL